MTLPPLGVVIVAFHGADALAETLAGLDRSERVVVVDNSSDMAVRAVAVDAGADYLDGGGNLGFAHGVNLGITHLAGGEDWGQLDTDVLLLNPDAVLTSDGLTRLQAHLHAPARQDVGALSPMLRSTDGEEQQVLWPWPGPAAQWAIAVGLQRHRQGGFAVGAVLLLRAEALRDVGPFDERYFLYSEEADWQRRASDRGWRSDLAPDVTAVHVGAGTSSDSARREVLFQAGQETYIRRWNGTVGWHVYRAAAIAGAAGRSVALKGDRARAAGHRRDLYLAGPRKRAQLPARPVTPLQRITHVVVTDNWAGTERYVSEVASGAAARGNDVAVVGGHRTRMPESLDPRVRWFPGGDVGTAARSVQRRGRTDVLHCHLTAADLVGLALADAIGARLVSTRHIAAPRGSSAPVRLLGKLILRRLDAQLAISKFVASAVEGPTHVLLNGVPEVSRAAAEREKVVLVAQRQESEKRTSDALRAFARSGLQEAGWRLRLLGEGVERPALLALRSELGLDESTELLGLVDDVQDHMLRSAILLATAPAEPLGLTVLEAMACGLPVIAAAGGGHLETLGLCADSSLYPPGDVGACATLLQCLAGDDDRRQTYGDELRELQQSRFSLDAHVSQLLELYAQLDRDTGDKFR